MDMGEMFDLLDTGPAEVTDRPDAPDLECPRGEVVFDNVLFGYDAAASSIGVSFRVPGRPRRSASSVHRGRARRR